MHHANPPGQFVNLRVRPRHAREAATHPDLPRCTAERVARTDELNRSGRKVALVIAGHLLL